MLRNQEVKSIMIKIIIFQLMFALIGFIIISLTLDRINESIVRRDMALIGNIIKGHPELERNLIPYVTKGASEEDIKIGQNILQRYGYDLEMDKKSQPLFENFDYNLQMVLPMLILLSTIPLVILIMIEYKKVYIKVEEVSNAAERVVEGDFSTYLKEEGEGDFNILNHQFNQMANRLENSLDSLKEEKTFLKNTISDISHQLKTPLSSLIIFNDLLLENQDMGLEDRINFLEKSKTQLNRMEWLIVNLLKVARIEAGAIEFKMERVVLKDVLNIALTTLSDSLEDQILEIKGNMNGIFYGDKNWTGEALINIIKNAIEHGNGKIEIILDETPLFSTITVRDNGEGIDKKHLPHIFERFYKVSSEVKPESIGIGLNLSRLIVESQGGTISVNSNRELGTEFVITFLKGIV